MIRGGYILYQDLAEPVQVIEAPAVETITMDKWFQPISRLHFAKTKPITHGIKSYNKQTLIIDGDARSFLTAAAITDSNIKYAVDFIVKRAKVNGWWNPCKAIYPFVGGIDGTHKLNLKAPQDTDAAYRITFSGGVTHSNTGALPNGSSGMGDTHFFMSSLANAATRNHLSFYTRTSVNSNTFVNDFGGQDGGNGWRTEAYSGTLTQYTSNGEQIFILPPVSNGYVLGSRVSSSDIKIYRNGVDLGGTLSGSYNGEITTDSVKLFKLPTWTYGDKEFSFATIGDDISSALALTMYNDIQAFQTILGRQV